jgi:tellurite resistance protein
VTVSTRSFGTNYSASVSTRQTPQTRARDIDRVNTCARLDLAYADGQLDASEHREFVTRAQAAKTLRELADLVRDLQPPEQAVEDDPPATRAALRRRTARSGPSRKLAWVVAAAAAAVAVAVAAPAGNDSPDSGSAAPAVEAAPADRAADPTGQAGSSAAETVEPVRPLAPGGFQRVVDSYRAEFGDTIAYEIILYPERAAAGRALPDAPDRIVPYSFKTDWQRSNVPASARFPGYRDFDAALVDAAALDDLIARAPGLLGAPEGVVTHVIIRDDGTPTTNIYVDYRNDRGNGYLKAGFDGSVLREYR